MFVYVLIFIYTYMYIYRWWHILCIKLKKIIRENCRDVKSNNFQRMSHWNIWSLLLEFLFFYLLVPFFAHPQCSIVSFCSRKKIHEMYIFVRREHRFKWFSYGPFWGETQMAGRRNLILSTYNNNNKKDTFLMIFIY